MNTALHLALALALFYVVNWLGAHSRSFGYMQLSVVLRTDEAPAFNLLLKTLSPPVFVILASAALYKAGLDSLVESIWVTAAFYWLIRVMFNLSLARHLLINWTALLLQAAASIGITYFVYLHWISPKGALLPRFEDLRAELWLAIALFVYSALNNLRFGAGATERRKLRYIQAVLRGLRPRFDSEVRAVLPIYELRLLAYAIMIHENFNRPALARRLERALGRGWVKSYGLMQVASDSPISDEESVALGLGRLYSSYLRHIGPSGEIYWGSGGRKVVADFNRDNEYVDEVLELSMLLEQRKLLIDLLPESPVSGT